MKILKVNEKTNEQLELTKSGGYSLSILFMFAVTEMASHNVETPVVIGYGCITILLFLCGVISAIELRRRKRLEK